MYSYGILFLYDVYITIVSWHVSTVWCGMNTSTHAYILLTHSYDKIGIRYRYIVHGLYVHRVGR